MKKLSILPQPQIRTNFDLDHRYGQLGKISNKNRDNMAVNKYLKLHTNPLHWYKSGLLGRHKATTLCQNLK